VFAPERDYQTPGFKAMAVIIQIVNASSSFKASALTHQQGLSSNASSAVIGGRLGFAPDHPAVRMVTDTWTVLFATSFSGLGRPGNEPIESRIVCERMCASFEQFRRSWAPWRASHADGQPPASATNR
jgi:hypothetical protein